MGICPNSDCVLPRNSQLEQQRIIQSIDLFTGSALATTHGFESIKPIDNAYREIPIFVVFNLPEVDVAEAHILIELQYLVSSF